MPITNQTYYNPVLVTAPKIDIDLLWWLTIAFLGLAALYFVSVFFFRNKISSQSSKTGQRKKELSPMISEFLFYEDNVDKAEKSRYIDLKIQIRELLKDDFNRKVLTEILLDLRKDVSGHTQKRLFNLYQDLGLEKDAFEKLASWRWEVISKGISHLTQMQVTSAYTFITKFINHRRGTIRKQAEIATVSLKPEGINYFLDTTRYKISEWQQLKLLDVIRNQEDFDPPRFKMWLTSTNKHVVLFALRLIKYYNQNDANSSLIELVKHKNNQIKTEALGCIKEFNVVEAVPTLKKVFHKGNVDVKIAMLGTIGNLGNPSDIEFLQTVAQREGNFSVKSKAFAAINMIAPETIMPTKGIEIISDNQHIAANIEENEKFTSNENSEKQSDGHHPVKEDENTLAADDATTTGKLDLVEENSSERIEETIKEEPEIESSVDVNETVAVEGIIEEALETEDIETLNNISTHANDEIVDKEEVANNLQTANQECTPIDEDSCESGSSPDQPICDTIPEDTSNNHKDIETTLHFDFIPIVINSEPKPDQPLKKYRPMANSKNVNKDLNNMEVDFEEVILVKADTEIKPATADFDISEIDFLPIVVDTEESEAPMANETYALSPLDMEVRYEELPNGPIDEELHDLIAEINELDFLPIVTDEEMDLADEQENESEPLASNTMSHIEGYTLSDFEVDFEETPIQAEEDNVSFNLEDAPIIDAQGSSLDDVMSWLMAHNELRQIETQYEIVSADNEAHEINELIPEPIYYDEHETYMMGLLDDLEELGDYREIPFLEELLAVEKKSFIKDRIHHLIARFSSRRDTRTIKSDNAQEQDVLPAFSVFADLFKNIDTECKLILLDEVVAVGDAKEIPFLDSLLEDPYPQIRKKAQTALKLLVAKISDNQSGSDTKKKQEVEELPTRIFDCDIPDKGVEKEQLVADQENLIVGTEINNPIDPEIMEIDFELSEVLDNGYSKKILNLPVVATEISPNGASLIFQLRHLPNNIIRKFNG